MIGINSKRYVLGLLGIIVAAALSPSLLFSAKAQQNSKSVYGGKSDVELAVRLWQQLKKKNLVGKERINVHAFKGKRPHGAIQQVYASNVVVNGRRGRVIVKANHRTKNVLVNDVYDDQNKYLNDYTVMFANTPGYDPENKNWFWVIYQPDGKIRKNGEGVPIAGRVGKGESFGCVGCHRMVGGEDLEALTSR